MSTTTFCDFSLFFSEVECLINYKPCRKTLGSDIGKVMFPFQRGVKWEFGASWFRSCALLAGAVPEISAAPLIAYSLCWCYSKDIVQPPKELLSQVSLCYIHLRVQVHVRFLWLQSFSSGFSERKYGRKIGQHFYVHMLVLLGYLQKYIFLSNSHAKFKLRGTDLIPTCLHFTRLKTKQTVKQQSLEDKFIKLPFYTSIVKNNNMSLIIVT